MTFPHYFLLMMLSVSLVSFLTISQTARANVETIELRNQEGIVSTLDVKDYDTTEELVTAIVKAIEDNSDNDSDNGDDNSDDSSSSDSSTENNNDNDINQNTEKNTTVQEQEYTCWDNSVVENLDDCPSQPIPSVEEELDQNESQQPPTAAVTTGGAAAAATGIPFPSVPALPTIPEDLTVEPEEEGDVNDPSEVVDQEIEDQKEDNKEEAVDANEKME